MTGALIFTAIACGGLAALIAALALKPELEELDDDE